MGGFFIGDSVAINSYHIGDLRRIAGAFKNDAGTATDPTTVRFEFLTPAGVKTTYVYPTNAQLVKDSTGNYHVDLTLTEAGLWFYRWEGEGAVHEADEGEFMVQPSGF